MLNKWLSEKPRQQTSFSFKVIDLTESTAEVVELADTPS